MLRRLSAIRRTRVAIGKANTRRNVGAAQSSVIKKAADKRGL